MPSSDRDVVETLRALGITQELIDGALERGDPQGAIFEAVLLPWAAERTVSAADVEAAGGLAVAEVQALMAAAGMPAPEAAQPAFTPAEAHVFIELEGLRDVWPPELATQLGRAYGRLLARLAQASVQVFRVYVERPLRAEGGDSPATAEAIHRALAGLVQLPDPLLIGVYRRWVEHELAQEVIREAETRTVLTLPGAVDVAFLFCDLKDFTAYADREGDEAAVTAIDRFAAVVSAERGERYRFQKSLGDGVMLAYGDAADAVAGGARIMAGMRAHDGLPGIHASVHKGVAVAREGDYFGGTVNLAARLLNAAGRDELIATRPVVDSSGDRFAWEAAGKVRVRGVRDSIEVFRLAC
ncbi:MAG TPA: adenylate/guanylate cyclase domain-containing protein [Solirubrobacteraceae bacterium]|jgi:class 3 adenylate cyclase